MTVIEYWDRQSGRLSFEFVRNRTKGRDPIKD